MKIIDSSLSEKQKVTIASWGSVDKCDHCGKEYTGGVACFGAIAWDGLELCYNCLENCYEEIK